MDQARATEESAIRILLVDDDEVDRRVIRRTLRRCGLAAEIEETASPERGVERARSGDCDCVLLDYRFPTGDAFELFGELFSQSCAHRPGIVLLTGMGDERVAAEAIQRGAQEYLSKAELAPTSIRRAIESAREKVMMQGALERRSEELTRMGLYDHLTGLPNRRLYFDRLCQAVREGTRSGSRFTVLMMDLDLFKAVNDSLGHEAGDDLLRQVSERLRRMVRDCDTVARIGGDEFAAVLSTAETIEGATVVAEKIGATMAEPFLIREQVAHVGISCGIARFPDHGETAEELVRRADMAMYEAKAGGRGVAVYGAGRMDAGYESALIAQGLRTALENDEMFVVYQPQVRLGDRKVVGVEALVRWHHPQLGLLSPSRFIPAAERSTLIETLTLRVLKSALIQQNLWSRRGQDLSISVNLSARLLDREEVVDEVRQLVRSAGIAPARLCLEVTETGIMSNPERAECIMRALSSFGVRISIDDFGTGYSSLKYLRNFPIDEIKIDRLFVAGLAREPRDRLIVQSILALGHAFGVRVVAEGIEDREVWRQLMELGCSHGQGFAIGVPMDGAAVYEWSEAWARRQQ